MWHPTCRLASVGAILYSQISVESYSPKGPETVKITTLYGCTGRLVSANLEDRWSESLLGAHDILLVLSWGDSSIYIVTCGHRIFMTWCYALKYIISKWHTIRDNLFHYIHSQQTTMYYQFSDTKIKILHHATRLFRFNITILAYVGFQFL